MKEKKMIPYEELTFSNDFLFSKIMESRPDFCKVLIEMILNRKVKEIRNPRSQFSVKETINGKGVRFDVIFEDDESIIYDVEMQTTGNSNLPKRTRYYQHMLDASSLESGGDYEELPQSYIIFICTFNPFEAGRHIYTFENRCLEDLSLSLGDMTRKIFLCTEGNEDDVSQPVLEFLEYVAGRSITGSFAENLESEVQRVKDEEKWRAEYMQNMAVIMDARREGRAEGRAEGLAEGRMEQSRVFYQNCIKRGMSDEDARALSGYQGKD